MFMGKVNVAPSVPLIVPMSLRVGPTLLTVTVKLTVVEVVPSATVTLAA